MRDAISPANPGSRPPSSAWLCLLACTLALANLAGGALLQHFPFDGSLAPAVGQEFGAPTPINNPAFVEGKHGQAVSLSKGAHVLVPLPKAICDEGEFTIAFWMKPLWHPQDDLPHPIFEIAAKPGAYDRVGWSTGQFLFSKGWSEAIAPNNVYGAVDSGVATLHLAPGCWTHVVLAHSRKSTFNASYFDGEGNRRPFKPEYRLHYHENKMWLGSRVNGRGTADVLIDDLKIFGHAVASDEIATIAGEQFPPPRDYALLGSEVDPAKAVQTPHRIWAKPYHGGRTKVLLVSEGVRAREIFELAQRFDIEPLTVTGPRLNRHSLGNPETFHEMGRRVEKLLLEERPDCVVIASLGWNLFLESTRDALLEYVRQGGGLLLAPPRCIGEPKHGISTNLGSYWVGWESTALGRELEGLVGRLSRDDEEYLVKSIPWSDLPQFRVHLDRQEPRSLFRGGDVGKGRVMLYDVHSCASSYTALTPGIAYLTPFDGFGYDYGLALAAKAVLWTARRDSAVRIRQVEYRTYVFSRRPTVGLRAGGWAVELWNGGTDAVGGKLTLSARNRGPDAPFKASRGITLKPGVTRVSMNHILDHVGTIFADVSLTIDDKVADWATGTITVQHGNPWLTELQSDRDVYSHGDRPWITGQVLYRDYATKPIAPGTLRWRLLDAWDRLVAQGAETVEFNPSDEDIALVPWSLPPLDSRSLSYRLVVDITGADDRVTDSQAVTLRCRRTDNDDFLFFSWGAGHTVAESLATVHVRDTYGLDCVSAQVVGRPVDQAFRDSLDWINRQNLRPWIHATALGGTVDQQYCRKPDLADPGTLASRVAKLKTVAATAEPYGPLYYSLGDETKLGPLDAHPTGHEQEAFRIHLQNRYKTLEALNATWGTEYKAWKEALIPSSDEMKGGKTNGKLLNELAQFRNTLFADTIRTCVDAIRSVAPDAKVGLEGIFGLQHAWGAFDYWQVTRASTFMGQYALGRELDMARSFQKPGDLLGCWYNYQKLDRNYSLYGPWHTLLRGLTAFGWYTTFEGSQYTMLNPDFSPFDNFRWTMEELAPIQAGIGKLVIGLERDDPGVFVLHDHRNLHRTAPPYHGMLVMTTLLQDIGYQHNWIHGDQILAGELRPERVKTLMLPGQYAMDQPVADAIRAFVKAGGSVVSDIYPGVTDGINRHEQPLLNDLFADAATLKGSVPPVSDIDLQAWTTHRKQLDQGHTLIFGRYAESYLRDRFNAPGGLLRQTVAAFLESQGATPAFSAQAGDGTFQPLTVVCYRDGNSRYVGIQREYRIPDQRKRQFEITGPGKAHIYDVRHGQYISESDRVKGNFEVARGALLAFLPYRAEALDVQGLPSTCFPGDRLQVRTILRTVGAVPDGGVVRVVVTGPAGEPLHALGGKRRSRAGIAEFALPIAFNDPIGAWLIQVTDIATGTQSQQHLQVQRNIQ